MPLLRGLIKGTRSPTWVPLCLEKGKVDFHSGGFTVITRNAPFVRTGARWHAPVPDGRVAMEMHDTFVMSCLFPDGHARSFEKLDRPFFKYLLCTNCSLSEGLAGSFVLWDGICAACCVSNDDRSGLVEVAACFCFFSLCPIVVCSTNTALAGQLWLLMAH